MRGTSFFVLATAFATVVTGATSTAFAQDASSTSASTSTAALPQQKPRDRKVELYAETASGVKDLANTVNTSNYVGANFKLGDSRSLSVRQQFTYNFPQMGLPTSTGKATPQDTYLSYTDGELAKFGDMTLTGIQRLYLPTGESSRNSGQIARLLNWMILSKPLTGKLAAEAMLISQYYAQSRESRFNSDGNAVANTHFSFDPSVGLAYSFTDNLSLSQYAGIENTWKRSVGGLDAEQLSEVYLTTYLGFSPISQFKVTAYLNNVVNVQSPSTPFQIYRGEETELGLILTSSL